jgi:hypothetical protein
MKFEDALGFIKNGRKMFRAGWPQGCFVYMQPGTVFTVERSPLLGIYNRGVEVRYEPHIDMRVASGSNKHSVWTPTALDLFADDWALVEGSPL